MNLDGDNNTDEYIVTALQIFDYCGANRSSTLRVDALMDKFAPFVKTNKAEYSYLRSLLDPNQSNPEITVSELATTLNKYSESQKIKVDLEESFNLKSGQVPHDSDSGISTDGFQLLEELQCELREKSHLAQQLRTQLDYSDRHHEEALAAVTAERDSLRAHLNMLREENMTLTHVRRDYEDVCERLSCSERALDDARRELETTRKRARVLTEQVTVLETEKLTVQELLSKSKEECHRINEMYATRQSGLLELNESLRTEHAELAARLQDQEEFMQQLIKEKVLLEMELKDMLNKSNQTHLRMERSIDVSYTEDQMLSALDSLNADSKFPPESRLLDEESFCNTLKDDQGRASNMSLFDEIRLSFCNMSRHNLTELNCSQPIEQPSETLDSSFITVATQTELDDDTCVTCKGVREKYDYCDVTFNTMATQTENNNLCVLEDKDDICFYDNYECRCPNDISLNSKYCKNELYLHRNKDENMHAIKTFEKSTNTYTDVLEVFKDTEVMNFGTQTDFVPYLNNNNDQNCIDCTKCVECDRLKKYTIKLENDIKNSHSNTIEMQQEICRYEDNLNDLKRFIDEGNEKNNFLRAVIDSLKAKLDVLEDACASQRDKIDELLCETCCAEIQTELEQCTVSTQAEAACDACAARKHSSLRKYLWEPLKSLFQLFAIVCFVCAVWALCNVTRRWRSCQPLPASWLQAHDILDLLLTVEYGGEVPM